jgi:hypothetical protein
MGMNEKVGLNLAEYLLHQLCWRATFWYVL